MVVRVNGRLVQRQGMPITCGDFHGIGVPKVRVSGLPVATLGAFGFTTGHQAFKPTFAVQASTDVKVLGAGVIRERDAYAPHSDGTTNHVGKANPTP